MPTSFPALPNPLGLRRILRAGVTMLMRGDLKVERQFRSRRIQHAWEFQWSALTSAQRDTLEAFMVTARGRILSDIDYVDPHDGLTYRCRLDIDDMEVLEQLPHFSSTLRLVEIGNWKAIKSAVPTFPATVPFQPATLHGRRYRTIIEQQEDFGEERYEDWSTNVRRWSVGGDALTTAQVNALLDCWEGNCGPWRPFSFTEPFASAAFANCIFVETEAVHTMVVPGVHSLRLTVSELKV